MKAFIRFLVLLLLFLPACVPTEDINAEATMQAAIDVGNAVSTIVAAGTPMPTWTPSPMPTWTPTSTSTPIPTPTPIPTSTPVTGWVLYSDGGEDRIKDMPAGFVPMCEGFIGCPGKYYQQFIAGTPVPAELGGVQGTPGYWTWVLLGVPLGVVFVTIVAVGLYTSTAPSRALARGVQQLMKAQAAMMQAPGNPQPPVPDKVEIERLAKWMNGFVATHQLPQPFVPEMNRELSVYKPGAMVSLVDIVTLLSRFDRVHQTNVGVQFGAYVGEISQNQLARRSNG